MIMLAQCRRLWRHAMWANAELVHAFRRAPSIPAAALREFAHVVGAEEVWLARLERRASASPVWPELSMQEAAALAMHTGSAYERYLAELTDMMLDEPVHYSNSAGVAFSTPVGDILLHVALHGQYHRGKVNVLLRQSGAEPAPVDFIAFVRGVAAARTP